MRCALGRRTSRQIPSPPRSRHRAAGAGWWVFDRDRWALRLGGALGESLGRGRPAPIGKASGVWRRHVHPDDRARLVQRLGVPGTVADFSPRFLAAVTYFDADSSLAAMVRAGREVCSCIDAGDTCNDAALIRTPYLAAEGLTAVVALPVEVGGRYVASLNLASRQRGGFRS